MRFLAYQWFLLLLSSLFSLLFHNITCATPPQCLNDQRTLLLQLRQNISSIKIKSWDPNTNCCSWDGVECNQLGRVTTLDLSNESLLSAFDNASALFRLQHLEKLNLAYNNFISATIPMDLGRLVNLNHLNLSNAGFTGQIPIQISFLRRLVSLDLSSSFANSLKLENPDLGMLVGNLSELKELYLDGLNMSSYGGNWCKALSKALPNSLRNLSLSNCQLKGPFDESFSVLSSLSELRLDLNNLTGKLPEFFGNFSNLTSLHLSTCGLSGKFPEKIFQLPLLKSLDVTLNPNLNGHLPDFPVNGSLHNLVLSTTNFSGTLPESIGNLKLLVNLGLTSCNFTGPLPKSMSNLTRLMYMDLSFNQFNGTVPHFSLAENLTQINLAHNRLTGPIPSSWENFSKLVNLNLRNNSLNGTISPALFHLPLLEKMDISHNGFTGQLGEFNVSSSLDTFDISGNKLRGPIPWSIFNLSGIKIFTVSSNNFNGTLQLQQFQDFRNLSSLDLTGNNLTIDASGINSALFPQVGTLKLGSCRLRKFPDFLKNQSKISFLDLSNNQIQGRIPDWIWEIGNGTLGHLNLSHNFLENPRGPWPNNSFNALAVVDLHSNHFKAPIPILSPSAAVLDYSNNSLASFTPNNISLYLSVTVFFSLSGNNLTGVIPSSICNASYLQVLDLSNNKLSGRIPHCLGNMSTLRVLNLRNNMFEGTIPETFPGCNLRTLNLNGNRLEGQVSKSLVSCVMLEVLDLGNNQINGTFPSWLGKLHQLRVLVLRCNRFHGPIGHSENVSSFEMLQIIDLSSNNFTGNLSSDQLFMRWRAMMMTRGEARNHQTLRFGFLELTQLYYQDEVTVTSKGMQMELVKILTIFTSIDFSRNRFYGEIPEALGNLTSLYVLNLSRNALTGPIPSSLGNLKQLESLDLSENKLNGMIPKQLADLTFLSVLNLSYNELVGRIPSGSQFQTFNGTSFEGNKMLCGSPLSNCTNSSSSAPSPKSRSEVSKDRTDFDWQYIVVGVGYGIGSGLIIGSFLFWPKGRKWYNDLIDRVVLIFLPSALALVYNVSDSEDWRPDAEETTEDDIWDNTEDNVMEDQDESKEEVQQASICRRGRYCVFCSKLDIRRKRAIHNPTCSCHVLPSTLNSSFVS